MIKCNTTGSTSQVIRPLISSQNHTSGNSFYQEADIMIPASGVRHIDQGNMRCMQMLGLT